MKSFLARLQSLKALILAILFALCAHGMALANNAATAACKNAWMAENHLSERAARHLRVGPPPAYAITYKGRLLTPISYMGRSLPMSRHVWGTCKELTSGIQITSEPSAVTVTPSAPASTALAPPVPQPRAAPAAAAAASPAKPASEPKIMSMQELAAGQPITPAAPQTVDHPKPAAPRAVLSRSHPTYGYLRPWYIRFLDWATSSFWNALGAIVGAIVICFLAYLIAGLLTYAWNCFQDWRDARHAVHKPPTVFADFAEPEEVQHSDNPDPGPMQSAAEHGDVVLPPDSGRRAPDLE